MQDTASVYYKYTSVTTSTANGITDVYLNVIVLYSYCSSCSSCSKFTVVTESKSLYMISKQFVNSTAVSVCTHVFYLVSPTRNILVLPKIPSIPQWVWFSISSTFNPFSSCLSFLLQLSLHNCVPLNGQKYVDSSGHSLLYFLFRRKNKNKREKSESLNFLPKNQLN